MPRATNKETQLSPRHVEALELLLAGTSITDVAKALRTDRKTIYRWLDIPEFADALKSETAARMKDSRRQFTAMMCDVIRGTKKAFAKLESIIDDKQAPAAIQVQAAGQIFSFTFEMRKIVEFEERIEQLEANAPKDTDA